MKSIAERIKEIDDKIRYAKGTLDSIMAIWNQVDRKRQSLITDLKMLEEQRLKVVQGQLDFDGLNEIPF